MARRLKLILALAVASAFILSAAACTSSAPSDTSSGPSDTTAATSTPAADSTTSGTTTEHVVFYNNFGTPYTTAGVTESQKAVYDAIHQMILDDIGVDVSTIIAPQDPDASRQKLNLLLTSGQEIGVFSGDFRDYYNQNVLVPLNDLLDQYGKNVKREWKEAWSTSWDAMTKDGKIWGIPRTPALFEEPAWFRTDWLTKVGKQMPKTVDEFEDVLKAFKEQDPAGNGETIPLLVGGLGQLNTGFAAAFMDQGYGDYLDGSGKVMPAVTNPQYRDFVAKMADWYQKGYIFKETYSSTGDRYKELVQQNKVASAILHETWITVPWYPLKQNVPDAEYLVDADLMGPKGMIGTCSDLYVTGILISSHASSPAACMKFIDWTQASLDNYLTCDYGIQGQDWKYTDDKHYQVERLSTSYIADFFPGTFTFTIQFAPSDPASYQEFAYYRDYVTDLDRVKKPPLYGITPFFDTDAINDALPNKADIDRMISEETVKFLTCVRPMSQWDQFMEELKSAGLDQWSQVMTGEYNRIKSSK